MLAFVLRPALIALFASALSSPSLAQADGYVKVRFLKAGLMVGGGRGSGVLNFRGRDYPFTVSGFSLGVTAGASVSRLEGRASGIVDVKDFAGGVGGVSLRNEKGIMLLLQGPKAGLEAAANVSRLTIALK